MKVVLVTKIKNLGYKPKDDYFNGLKKTVEWYKNYYDKRI